MRTVPFERYRLTGLETRPAQTWGPVRLVPLVRAAPVPGLRLHRRLYDEPHLVDVGDGSLYTSYIPHAFVATWEDDEDPAASYGARLVGRPADRAADRAVRKDLKGVRPPGMPIPTTRRVARRLATDRLRFLPLHVALEGYLALHFGGPVIAWSEWSERAVRNGLSPRCEEAYLGLEVRGLDDALRVFEIHPGQCGVLVYVADALATAFVVPHPEDYRALHRTLLEDQYGELIYQYGQMGLPAGDLAGRVDQARVRSLADLRAEAARVREEWAAFHDDVMAARLFDEEGTVREVQYLNGFVLSRFLPSFRLRREGHIGEAITDDEGNVAYLKSFRLSDGQTRRGHLLSSLAAHDWSMKPTAGALGTDEATLALRLERSGFGHLLRQDVLDHYRAQARRGGSGR
ncbi:hypothetical protein ACFVH6_42760 [Spirillospora sp. NPDC127200]